MPIQYSDMLNDLFASTGLNLGASFGYGSDLFRRAIGTTAAYVDLAPGERTRYGYAYDKNKALRPGQEAATYVSYNKLLDGANPFDQAAVGLRSHSSLFAARDYDLRRREQSGELYQKLVDESTAYRNTYDQLMLASDLKNETFMQLQSELDASKLKLGAKSSVSSLGAYSAAAKRQMQETSRVLAQLNATTAPQQESIDTSFIDPITGNRVGQDATFAYSSENIGQLVSDMVTGDYMAARERIIDEIDAGLAERYGYTFSQYYGQERKDAMAKAEEYMGTLNTYEQKRLSEGYYNATALGDSGMTYKQYQDLAAAQSQYDNILNFAESRALAELTGTTEGYRAERPEGSGMAGVFMTGSQMFMGVDRDEILQQIITDTTTRFETADLSDMKLLEAEFNSRKKRAEAMAADTQRRNQLNQARTEDIERQKIEYARMLKQQQEEYKSTLGSAGAVETANGGVTFTSIRPA